MSCVNSSRLLWSPVIWDAAICFQSGLLQLSGLSADLDVLNELSRSLTPGDAAARRLQRLNRCWADASARAEEACRSDRRSLQEYMMSWCIPGLQLMIILIIEQSVFLINLEKPLHVHPLYVGSVTRLWASSVTSQVNRCHVVFWRCVFVFVDAQRAADGGTEAAELWAEVWELDVVPAEDGGRADCRRGRFLHRPQRAALHTQGMKRDKHTHW